LEKTSKIIKSNLQPNTTLPGKPCLKVPHLHIFWTTSRDGSDLPWAAFSNASQLFQ